MNRPGFWIVVILVIVWQLVGRFIQRAAAKERQRKLAEMSRSPRQPQTAAPAAAHPAPAPRPSGEDLAARRRAQIEELRQRRETRLGPAAPGQVQRPRPGALPRPAPLPRPVARPVARPVGIPIPPRTAMAPRPPRPPPTPPPPPPQETPEEPVVSLLEESPPPAAAPPARRPAAILGQKVDRSSLRRVVVLREILDPPVSLREPYTAAP